MQHEKKCRQEGRKRLTKEGKEVSFHQFKIVLKLQLQSLNLDPLLKVLTKSKGRRNPGKSQP